MRTATRTRALTAVAALVALLGILVLLSGTLGQLDFRPGLPLAEDQAAADTEIESDARPEILPTSGVSRLIAIVMLSSVIASGTLAILSRDFRRAALMYLTSACTFGAFLLVGMRLLEQFRSATSTGTSLGQADPLVVPSAEGVHAPSWVLALLVVILGLASIAAIAIAVARIRRWWLLRRSGNESLDDLLETVAETADSIRTGADLRSAVIRCYQEMQEILSRRRGLRPTYMTPREFADSLQEAGLGDNHVDRLTSLFELVRYGSRSDDEYAAEALDCLDAIQSAHRTHPEEPA